jgi:transposase
MWMGYIEGEDRKQTVLFPEVLDDYISEENAVRFIDVFIEGLDLSELGFLKAIPKETGRPPYDPGDLLRLYVYGYLNRTRSSRRLETEAGRNVELMWLMRKLRPDFKTIADFRKDKGLSRCVESSRYGASGWSYLGESWWPSTAVNLGR